VPKDFDPSEPDSSVKIASQTPSLRRMKGPKESKESLPPRTFDESKEDEIIQLLEDH
jgi:hypothetical protein